jgi:LDH2 family malate/lactate/ureidoglycolate dehydrogenase
VSDARPHPFEGLRRLGLSDDDAAAVLAHLEEADRRGKAGHGVSRVAWLETQSFDPAARPARVESSPGCERWDGRGALGYLTLEAIVRATISSPPDRARVIVAERCFPSGDGRPLVADVSMGAVTHGDVLTGRAKPDELVPFGGPQAHKAFALAVGIELLVGALAGPEHGVVLVVARPDHDPGGTIPWREETA